MVSGTSSVLLTENGDTFGQIDLSDPAIYQVLNEVIADMVSNIQASVTGIEKLSEMASKHPISTRREELLSHIRDVRLLHHIYLSNDVKNATPSSFIIRASGYALDGRGYDDNKCQRELRDLILQSYDRCDDLRVTGARLSSLWKSFAAVQTETEKLPLLRLPFWGSRRGPATNFGADCATEALHIASLVDGMIDSIKRVHALWHSQILPREAHAPPQDLTLTAEQKVIWKILADKAAEFPTTLDVACESVAFWRFA